MEDLNAAGFGAPSREEAEPSSKATRLPDFRLEGEKELAGSGVEMIATHRNHIARIERSLWCRESHSTVT